MKNMYKTTIVLMALALFAAGGCSENKEPAPEVEKQVEKEPDPVKRRMKDPEYVKKLHAARAERKVLRVKVEKAMEAYQAAKDAKKPAAEVAQLKKELDKAVKEMAKQQRRTNDMIAERIRGSIDGTPAKAK